MLRFVRNSGVYFNLDSFIRRTLEPDVLEEAKRGHGKEDVVIDDSDCNKAEEVESISRGEIFWGRE